MTLPRQTFLVTGAQQGIGAAIARQLGALGANVGVNFLDEEETNIRAKSTGEVGKFDSASKGLRLESGPASDPLFWALLVIGGLAILANWYLLASRESGAQRRAARSRNEGAAHG